MGHPMANKDNQRTRLTKMLLKNSLIALLHKKPIYQISVSELCSAAELNRSTFYKHYGNVHDILQEIEDETLSKGTQCIQEIEDAGIDYGEKVLYQLLCDVMENKDVYQLLMDNSIHDHFPARMLKDTVYFFKERIQSIERETPMSDYVFNYLVSGCISVIQNWLAGSMTETPEEIAKLMYSISIAILECMDMLPQETR